MSTIAARQSGVPAYRRVACRPNRLRRQPLDQASKQLGYQSRGSTNSFLYVETGKWQAVYGARSLLPESFSSVVPPMTGSPTMVNAELKLH